MESIRAELQRAMEARGIRAKPLSIAAGLGPTAVRDILRPGSTDVKLGTLRKLADVLDWPVNNFMGRGVIRIEGKIGAGGQVLFDEFDEKPAVPRPPGAAGKLMALEVQGDSMMPVYRNGDVVYVERDHDGVLPEYLGEECAIHTADGGTWLKVLSPGSRPGRYTLRSFNAADMEDVEVIWAAPVCFVWRQRRLPRSADRHQVNR